MKKDEKLALCSERIHDFQTSGQSCKAWCQENQIPISTMGYWMRRLRNTGNFCEADLIMPTEQEIAAKETANSLSPIHIFIADSIRIEVMPDCSPKLFHLLIKGLKDHA